MSRNLHTKPIHFYLRYASVILVMTDMEYFMQKYAKMTDATENGYFCLFNDMSSKISNVLLTRQKFLRRRFDISICIDLRVETP